MLATILMILKIIGLVMLGIAGLVLAVILLVLLVPVRYRAEGSYCGALRGKANISWLLHILSVSVTVGDGMDIAVRVFGVRLGGRKQKKKEKRPKRAAAGKAGESAEAETGPGAERMSPEPESTERGQESAMPGQKSGSPGQESGSPGQESAMPGQKSGSPGQESAMPGQETGPRGPAFSAGKRKKKKPAFSIRRIYDKLRAKLESIRGRLRSWNETRERILDFLRDEENRRTLRLIRRQLAALLRHVLPRRIKGRIRFGFDDPYTTGQVLQYVSPFYGLYAGRLELIPVFEERVLEGEGSLRGRIRIAAVLMAAGRVWSDKNFRTLVKKWREA